MSTGQFTPLSPSAVPFVPKDTPQTTAQHLPEVASKPLSFFATPFIPGPSCMPTPPDTPTDSHHLLTPELEYAISAPIDLVKDWLQSASGPAPGFSNRFPPTSAQMSPIPGDFIHGIYDSNYKIDYFGFPERSIHELGCDNASQSAKGDQEVRDGQDKHDHGDAEMLATARAVANARAQHAEVRTAEALANCQRLEKELAHARKHHEEITKNTAAREQAALEQATTAVQEATLRQHRALDTAWTWYNAYHHQKTSRDVAESDAWNAQVALAKESILRREAEEREAALLARLRDLSATGSNRR
ncbi:hypothetical protein CC85DRAFT_302651 [Cutaneotrichosporon oleaginosum]|uniref:Uncharacterized protein n=1 Tax=Cutaneotrichosporon oleaginosum TaxID=879819 RepID=A0A0J1B3A3_9TREE|nr:uncharacterized protein CC85DRAFT_302651 [Cutaneotrichosporon oleaginosum]KLT42099.1 hypothetical protein CC85DRAFT_302651 [Cutaneotrichosporon oleaginosum]TXT04662.1 hypothetical protein COLE_07481 [Cutaneotrichosporon oleaginosum]